MNSVTEHIRQHLLSRFYFPGRPVLPLHNLKKTQWCDEYEQYRRNRMVMGTFRYGDIHRQQLDNYDLPAEAKKRIDKYIHDRNLEHLVDAGNMLMLAYMQGRKRNETFNSIDDGEHAHESNLD